MSDPFLEMLAAADPSPLLHALRASDPVHLVEPLGFWLVTRHDDVKRLYNDPDNVTNDKRVWEHNVPHRDGTMLRWAEDHGLFSLAPEDHARVRRLVFGAADPRGGAAGSVFNVVQHPALNHRIELTCGVLAEECGSLLKEFFLARR